MYSFGPKLYGASHGIASVHSKYMWELLVHPSASSCLNITPLGVPSLARTRMLETILPKRFPICALTRRCFVRRLSSTRCFSCGLAVGSQYFSTISDQVSHT